MSAIASVLRRPGLKKILKHMPIYLMMLPGLIYLFINNYLPMPGIVVAFKNFNARDGLYNSPWAGLENFRYLFATNDAWIITRNTILYNLAFIVVNTVLAIFVAILLSDMKSKRFKKFGQSAILLPFLISWVIVSYLVFAFLSGSNGFINNTILPLLGRDAVNWYSDAKNWPYIIIIANAWRTIGYNCIIYLASIIGIDRGLYESAEIDGANKWKQIWSITLPLLRPTIIILTLLSIGRIFYSDFGLFYQVPMNTGALYPTTNTIDTYVYRGLLQLNNISMASAAGLYQSLVGFILIMGSNLLVRKIDRENALF